MLREVTRVRRGRRDRIERGPAGDAVVVMVEVAVTEEDRGGIGAEHDLGAELPHVAHDRAAELLVVGYFAVGIAEVEVPGEAQERDRLGRLLDPQRGELVEIGAGIGLALVAERGDEGPHLRALLGPPRERAARRDLGVVGVRVDRERTRGNVVGHGSSVVVTRATTGLLRRGRRGQRRCARCRHRRRLCG